MKQNLEFMSILGHQCVKFEQIQKVMRVQNYQFTMISVCKVEQIWGKTWDSNNDCFQLPVYQNEESLSGNQGFKIDSAYQVVITDHSDIAPGLGGQYGKPGDRTTFCPRLVLASQMPYFQCHLSSP